MSVPGGKIRGQGQWYHPACSDPGADFFELLAGRGSTRARNVVDTMKTTGGETLFRPVSLASRLFVVRSGSIERFI
jgi:hypothetical protein